MSSTSVYAMAAQEYLGVYRDGCIVLAENADLPEGCQVIVRPMDEAEANEPAWTNLGKVIIAGFGLAGRWVADIFLRHGIDFTIIEKNQTTVETQRKLGNKIVCGDADDEETLIQAGIAEASILALTIPDEEAVLRATAVAKRLKPDIYIIARTTYSSKGMEATQLGADAVIKAEQAVARQFYEMLQHKLQAETKQQTGP